VHTRNTPSPRPKWSVTSQRRPPALLLGQNRATLAVARKLVAYLMAVDRDERPFDTQMRVAGNAA
jgi:hypothetical protein